LTLLFTISNGKKPEPINYTKKTKMSFEYDRTLIDMDTFGNPCQINSPKKNLLTPWDILNSIRSPINYTHDNNEVFDNSLNNVIEDTDNLNIPYDNEQDFSEYNSDSEYSTEDEDSDWENLASNRMKEIQRKEEIIVQKDNKASRLIDIIREKNDEIEGLKKKNLEQRRQIWKLYKKIHDSNKTLI
jgi:hypothetical protein